MPKLFELEHHHDCCHGIFNENLDMDKMLALRPEIEELMPSINKPLLINLKAVDFLDSSAVGILALFYKNCYKINQKIAFLHPTPQAQAVLSMVGLGDLVPSFESTEEAISYLIPST